MKSLLISTALAASFAVSASAQTTSASPFQTGVIDGSVTASDVIGARIYTSETEIDAEAFKGRQESWNDIGEVNDIILGRDGRIDAVLVDIGGFLGIGERKVAVDMDALRFVQDSATDADDWFLVLRADRATIDAAPEWQAAGMMPADPAMPLATNPQTTVGADAGLAAAQELPEGYVLLAPDALTADMLKGSNVYGPKNDEIAEVADLVLTADGKVTNLVMDVGGFLGMGEKRVAIPMERVSVANRDGADLRVYIDMTEDELKALPDFKV